MTRNGRGPRHRRRRRRDAAGAPGARRAPAEAPPAPREPGAARRAPVGPRVARRAGAAEPRASGGAGGSTTTLADPCRGTALPTTGHYVPAGMCARTDRHAARASCGSSRSARTAICGASTPAGQIKRFRDANGDGVFQTARDRQLGVHRRQRPERAHRRGGRLPLFGNERRACAAGRGRTRPTPAPAGQEVLTGQPTGGHGKHTVHVWDGWMYVHVRVERQRHQPPARPATTPRATSSSASTSPPSAGPRSPGCRAARSSSTGSATCSASPAMGWAACTACRTARTTSPTAAPTSTTTTRAR